MEPLTQEQYMKMLDDSDERRIARLEKLLNGLMAEIRDAFPPEREPSPDALAAQKAGQEKHYRFIAAVSALQGLLANSRGTQMADEVAQNPDVAATLSCEYADALIAKLAAK